MKLIKTMLVLAVFIFTAGCATGRSPVSPGFLVTFVEGSESVTPNALGSKRGSACATNVLGWVAFGNASIQAAAKDAGITKISHVDYSTNSILMLYATSCTKVYGE